VLRTPPPPLTSDPYTPLQYNEHWTSPPPPSDLQPIPALQSNIPEGARAACVDTASSSSSSAAKDGPRVKGEGPPVKGEGPPFKGVVAVVLSDEALRLKVYI